MRVNKKLIAAAIAALCISSAAGAASFSSGSSVGMSRPSTMSTYRLSVQQRSAVPAQSYSGVSSGNGSYSSGSYNTYNSHPQQGYNNNGSGGIMSGNSGTFVSSLGGSMAGTMLGNALSTPHTSAPVVVNSGAVAPIGAVSTPTPAYPIGGGVAPVFTQPQAVYSTHSTSFFGFLFNLSLMFLWVGAMIVFCVWAWRKYKQWQKKEEINMELSVPFSPVGKFVEIQRAYADNNKELLREMLGYDLVHTIDEIEAVSTYSIRNISYEVVDVTPSVVSIHYKAYDFVDKKDIDEVWHYILIGGVWKLNGVEAV